MINKKIFHCLLIVIIGLACYSNSFTVPFSFDDELNITDNTFIRDLDNFTGSAQGYASDPGYNPRRYVGLLTFALNYRLHGLDVVGYHAVNISIHVINAVLVYFLVLLTFRTPYFRNEKLKVKGERSEDDASHLVHHSPFTIHFSRFFALAVALLFVAHPIQTQAVTYIVQRYTSLATLFYLLSLVMYIQGRLKSQSAPGEAHGAERTKGSVFPPMPYALCSLLSAVLAMKTKEISFTLPFMISLYEFTFFRVPLRKKLLFLVPVLLTLIIIPVTIIGTDKPLGDIISDLSAETRLQTDMPRWDYLFTEMRVIVTYLRLLVMPVNQNLDYDYPIYHSLFAQPVFLSFLFLLALFGTATYLLYKSRSAGNGQKSAVRDQQTAVYDSRGSGDSLFTLHYSRLIAFGILWFFIALSVESSIIPITDVIFEHRVYLPSVGAFIALAAGLYIAGMKMAKRWPGAQKVIIPSALIILTVLSAVTFARNRVWKDNITLWEDVVSKSPRALRPHVLLGQALLRGGNADRAIAEIQRALAIKPFSFNARIYLGMAFAAKGWNDEAIEQYRIATLINPNSADARNNLGNAFFKKGAVEQAIEQYKVALTLRPTDANFHFNLGIAYEQRGLVDAAMEEYKAAVRLKPTEPAFNQALAYASEKRKSLWKEAPR